MFQHFKIQISSLQSGNRHFYLEIDYHGLHQEEDDRVIFPVDVGGCFAEFNTSDGGALGELPAPAVPRQGLPQVVQEQLLQDSNQE